MELKLTSEGWFLQNGDQARHHALAHQHVEAVVVVVVELRHCVPYHGRLLGAGVDGDELRVAAALLNLAPVGGHQRTQDEDTHRMWFTM